MQIKRKTAFTVFLSFFLMCSCVTLVFADDTPTGRSPGDVSTGVIYPAPQVQEQSQKEQAEKADEALKRTSSLSYGMEIIKHKRKLIKTSSGGSVDFSLADFLPFSDNGAVSVLTVVSVPDPSAGVLKTGALDAYGGQRLPAQMADKLCFTPAPGATVASFEFSVNGSEEKSVCVIYTLKKENTPPTAITSKAYTKTDIPSYGRLKVSDEDNDVLNIRVTKAPSHGKLTVNSDLTYVYIPDEGFRGKDGFSYVAVDAYGAQSEPATVSVTVEKRENGVVYSDVAGTEYEYAAVLLSEKGILTGESVAGTMRFEPDKKVSRADFIVMAMSAAGYSPNLLAAQSTGLADEDKLTSTQKGYVVTAMSAGVLTADEYDGVKLIRPSSSVTCGEAAAIAGALGAKTETVFENANEPLSRAEAAVMLASLIDLGR